MLDYLSKVDPTQRIFPVDWKEAYFFENYNDECKGYICPSCGSVFKGSAGFKGLHGDHILPISKGGLTVWENLQLLCRSCNYSKSNKIE